MQNMDELIDRICACCKSESSESACTLSTCDGCLAKVPQEFAMIPAVCGITGEHPHGLRIQNSSVHGSYFLGKTKDENLTASEMGNSPGVVIKHYRALVRDAEVERYWRIVPGNVQVENAGIPPPPV